MPALESMHRFAVGGDRSDAARLFLCASAAATLMLAFMTLWLGGSRDNEGLLATHTVAVALADALHVVTVVAVAVWIHRAYANLGEIGTAPTFRPFTAAAYFVIPGANLLVPHTVFRELWRGSQPSNPRTLSRPLSVVLLWWYAFVVASVATNIGVAWIINDPENVRARALLFFAPVIATVAAFGGMDVVRMIDARQSMRRNMQRLRNEKPPAPAPASTPVARSDWRAMLMPIVTTVEKEMERTASMPSRLRPPLEVAEKPIVAEAWSVEKLPIPDNVPADLQPAPNAGVMAAYGILAALAVLQALLLFGLAANPQVAFNRAAGCIAAFLPLGIPVYVAAYVASTVFQKWLGRAYANLRAYVPELDRDDPAHEFARGFGDAMVLEELWRISTTELPGLSPQLFKRWLLCRNAWRVAMALFGLTLVLASSRQTLFAGGFAFLLWSVNAILALCICRDVDAAQRRRLTRVKSAAPAATETPLPPPLPQ